MKAIKFMLFAMGMVGTCYAQQAPSVTLSEQYPQAGKTIKISYDAGNGLLQRDKALTAKVYYADAKKYPVDEVSLKNEDKLWTGEVTVEDSAKAFLIKITGGSGVDSNSGKGYIYLVYKDQNPIKGAYAANALMYIMYKAFGINEDVEKGITDYKKEFELYPESKKANLGDMYHLMLRSSDENKGFVNKQISDFKGSDDEKDYSLIINALYDKQQVTQADSLRAVAAAKFPKGNWAVYNIYYAFYMSKELPKRDSLYNAYIKIHEPDEYMTQALAIAYVENLQLDKYEQYKAILKDKASIGNSLNSVAYDWAKQGQHLPEAEKIAKEGMVMLKDKLDHAESSGFSTLDEVKKQAQTNYDYVAETYNYILYKEGKYDEAVKLQAVLYPRYAKDPDFSNDYALMLVATKNYDKATEVVTNAINNGKVTTDLMATLKQSYIGKHGNDKGFDAYVAPINDKAKVKEKEALAKTMINIPAPGFTLKDLDGKNVSLAELKGKVVIIDYWATWCGPCKASMPGMQLAVNKYKDNPNVKFLFIDVWENGDDYLPKVKKFIGDNKYTFDVLLDEKDKSGQQAKVISQYNVDGIPTKFIIDKNGNIRFKHVGYDGSDSAVLNEVSSMIDMAAE